MAEASLSVSPLFGDHAVIQRGVPANIWGWAPTGKQVTVSLGDQSAKAVAGADGRWQATLAPLHAGGPFELRVGADSGESIVSRDILIGEVWLCGGQSNMEWTNAMNFTAASEIEMGQSLPLRCITLPRKGALAPEKSIDAAWQPPMPENVAQWTAVGYAFARHLHKALGVPIGLVSSNFGGASAEAFVPRDVLANSPGLKPIIDRLPPPPSVDDLIGKVFEDPGNVGAEKGWQSASFNDADWKTMELPTTWQRALNVTHNGSMWFRRTVELSAADCAGTLQVALGACDDFDVTYFNGKQIGATGPEVPNSWQAPREYAIPAGLAKPGKNVIAVRVFDQIGGGGMIGPADRMVLTTATRAIPLDGAWKYQVELAMQPTSTGTPVQNHPSLLFNAMIAPLTSLTVAGAIWYQGESNADRAWQYRELMCTMIDVWRKRFGWDFPFYQVQLANFTAGGQVNGDSAWAELRESQQWVAAHHPHGGMVVALDSGHAIDIHPRNKVVIGYRLALLARAKAYGQTGVEYSGPTFAGFDVEQRGAQSEVRVHFDHAEGLYAIGDGKVFGFEVAGDDRKWRSVEGEIEGSDVLLRCGRGAKPMAVRYAWADNPRANLLNVHGLAAEPFRTDDWPRSTVGNF